MAKSVAKACGSPCILPFKDQSSANIVKQQLSKLSLKVGTAIQHVFVGRKLNEDLKGKKPSPPLSTNNG